ncbi:hypothetical protein PV05_01065 [Exophiala xenobiotica]|uniref:Uncharacterized protein n=1 Tax=Exophiala xenobiotica TaxID=348802 RepID=A0A0D2EYR8_9EURO|nr:uncharacterized protein PV05_01065 [Exophiala xenobiotica]KIW60883.1 hypothetical protein PV05_01065 [Exophiala xenobiotica]
MKRRDTGYTHWFNLEFEEILQGYTYDFYRFELLPGQLAISIASLPLAYSDRLQQLISAKSATIKTDFECSIAVEERVLCPDGKKEVETVNIDVLGAVLVCDSTVLRLDKLPNLANEPWFKEWSQYARLEGAARYKDPSWNEEERMKVQLDFDEDM